MGCVRDNPTGSSGQHSLFLVGGGDVWQALPPTISSPSYVSRCTLLSILSFDFYSSSSTILTLASLSSCHSYGVPQLSCAPCALSWCTCTWVQSKLHVDTRFRRLTCPEQRLGPRASDSTSTPLNLRRRRVSQRKRLQVPLLRRSPPQKSRMGLVELRVTSTPTPGVMPTRSTTAKARRRLNSPRAGMPPALSLLGSRSVPLPVPRVRVPPLLPSDSSVPLSL